MLRKEDILQKIKEVGSKSISPGGHLILYGSQARGDAKSDSDWDILVLLDKAKVEQQDYDGVGYLLTTLGWELGEMIIPVIYTKDEWNSNSFTPFYKNVESEGIVLL